jgi:hypothetical protein
MRRVVFGAVLLAGVGWSGAAFADNNTCLQSGGAWKATGTIKSFVTVMGFYSFELASLVVASPPEVRSALQPVITGECMVGWGAGEGRPPGCAEGTSVTMSGPVTIDERKIAGIQVRTISCG